jgi:hypothetical protein
MMASIWAANAAIETGRDDAVVGIVSELEEMLDPPMRGYVFGVGSHATCPASRA